MPPSGDISKDTLEETDANSDVKATHRLRQDCVVFLHDTLRDDKVSEKVVHVVALVLMSANQSTE